MNDKYLEIAIKAARAAGKIHLEHFRQKFELDFKSSNYDLVTSADTESEIVIKNIIKESFPDHGFLGEEEGSENPDADFIWIIDPLDGTNNFASGMPIFCCSIALAYQNEVIVGVIYDPTRDELFSASKGGKAFLNNKPIGVSHISDLKQSLLITGFYYSRGEEMVKTLENIKKFMQQGIVGIRRLGSAALDISYVAAGRASGYWEFELSPWDFAAAKLILEEAGGIFTDINGNNPDVMKKTYAIAANPHLHSGMIKILSSNT